MVPPKRLGLILPAGGARAAYQVGALKWISENIPEFAPRIFTGISAGSINSSFLAQGEPFPIATQHLHQLWQGLEFGQVVKTNFKTILGMGSRWAYDIFLSKVTNRLLVKSLLDASPLSTTLLTHVHFWRITKALRAGLIDGVAVTATNYYDQTSTVFFDSHAPIQPWSARGRKAVRTAIRVRHIMASCSIPLLFEPVRIADGLFGDGALGVNFPFSPGIHLGATHLFGIGNQAMPKKQTEYHPDHVSMGFIAGVVLNSIFVDTLEIDYENLVRLNQMGQGIENTHYKKIPVYLLKPSQSFAEIATAHLSEVPFHLRQLINSTASRGEIGDLLSYLMFAPGFIRTLLELGKRDAESKADEIIKFLG